MKKVFMLCAGALLVSGLAACSDDDGDNAKRPVKVTWSSPYAGNVLVTLRSEEFYDVDIPEDAVAWVRVNAAETAGKVLVLAVDENETGAERSATVTVTGRESGTLLATVSITQLLVNPMAGQFVIEEIFWTGTPLESTGRPDTFNSDQYIKIRNNSDKDLYADGMLLILQSSLLSNSNSELPEGGDFRKWCCAGSAFYAIPGNGQEVPVKAGETLLIANNAQKFTSDNPASWDATTADFEWYDISSNDRVLDTDNPDVPNLDKWYASTITIHSLHMSGAYAIALAMPPAGMTADRFLSEYALEGYTYIFHSPNGSDYTQPVRNAYGVPNSWVLDAVNCGTRDGFYLAPWDSSLDAGYAWCGITTADADYYGKAVIRKTGANGKLVDTNNSTNDFEHSVKASLIR